MMIVVCLSALGVIADGVLKRASADRAPWVSPWFIVGVLLYAATAFGWVHVLRSVKLATVGVVYCVATMLLLTLLGVLVFGESLGRWEVVGLVLGVVSCMLLWRFG